MPSKKMRIVKVIFGRSKIFYTLMIVTGLYLASRADDFSEGKDFASLFTSEEGFNFVILQYSLKR